MSMLPQSYFSYEAISLLLKVVSAVLHTIESIYMQLNAYGHLLWKLRNIFSLHFELVNHIFYLGSKKFAFPLVMFRQGPKKCDYFLSNL